MLQWGRLGRMPVPTGAATRGGRGRVGGLVPFWWATANVAEEPDLAALTVAVEVMLELKLERSEERRMMALEETCPPRPRLPPSLAGEHTQPANPTKHPTN